ncbi:MAG TPA: hypothetical protein VD816_03390 [Ohtaekwangia sp.]|nr:hypothetical protein [Ohtaekwangia sp.]
MKVALIKVTVLFFFVSSAYGQKIKYKDIFGLLSTKQYEAAEPFLKKYLQENTDNPNAFLYMGIIYQDKSSRQDILKNTGLATALMDSAVFFYQKAYSSLTEKEVKRNDEYYQVYNRRDLRTGEFGVKLSDIQFDLEKKMEGLRERIDRVKMVKHYFALADSLYTRSRRSYTALRQAYPSEKQLYLRADETTLQALTALALRYDSSMKAFETYKASSSNLGKTGYNQVMTKNDIVKYETDGATPANFYQDDLQVWDYRKFADQARLVIEKEIMPMREHLVTYDVEINKLREKLNQDSVSVKNDLTSLIEKILAEQLKKYDSDPLPIEVFSLKIADLEYRSALLEDKKQSDSSNVRTALQRVNEQSRYLKKLDSIASKMMAEDIDKKAEDYKSFIANTYSNTVVLKSYVKALKEFAEREKRTVDEKLKACSESLRWLVSAPDSVPLFYDAARSKFKPLLIVDEQYTTGLLFNDTTNAQGYFYSITPSRVPDIRATFPLEKGSFRYSRAPVTRSLLYADPAGQIFFVLIYGEKAGKENKYPATLAKIYRSDGLAWSNNYAVSFLPREISFKPETGELTIKADAHQAVIDKNGKMK